MTEETRRRYWPSDIAVELMDNRMLFYLVDSLVKLLVENNVIGEKQVSDLVREAVERWTYE